MASISNVPRQTILTIRKSSTMRISCTVLSSGVPMNLAGATITGKVGDLDVEADIGVDPTDGTWSLEIEPADVSASVSSTWYLDLTDSLGAVIPLLRGPLNVVE